MGSAYEHLSREELLALLATQPGPAPARSPGDPSEPPSSGDRYRQMVEDAADGMFLSDSTGTYLDVNEVGARMLGMTRDEVIGKNVSDIVVDAEQHDLAETRARVSAGEWVLREWQIRRKDGSTFTGEVSAKLLPDGRFQGIWRDVSARHAREEALKLSEQRFRALTAAAFEGIGISERGVVVDVNDQLAHLLGYERGELIGKDVSQIVAPESREAVSIAIRSGRETPYRHLALKKDGARIEVEAQARMAEWSDRAVRVTAIRDVTARLQLEERVNRVQKLEALGRLAGGIAHDFNNILVAIFSYTDLTELDADDPAQVRAHMEGLRAAAHRARDLVHQILTFSRQKGEARETTRVQPIIEEALRFLRSTLPATIELRSQIDGDCPVIHGAPVQIHQVIMNLCVNAAHAIQKTGLLSVRLSRVVATPELVLRVPELRESRTYARLSVQDTGRGMDTETMSRIFEPFFTTKSSGEGSGLGLAVVHGIVKSHDGAIVVESEVGVGTTFEV
ncbi:MAG TPA: PAS domain S-box protein, partial [Polyangiaceae bacterium]|nr:PAS domain S-box protein [Polyangiaceae bacterium]